tara:strand:- start:154 stop:1785 length:1632 start_codon:yes stop_codon:yes gene_type:complete
MLIGLDFDNTIACYNSVFSSEAKLKGLVNADWKGNKDELKHLLCAREDGQTLWQKIQGQVYGPSMQKATLFHGLARFLFRCKLNGHKIFIVSHKTKYGHFDKTKTLLRQESLKWMDNQGFFDDHIFGIKKNNIFFANTQNEKVLKIKSLKLDLFIDDLEEIFLHHDFPEIKKILFNKPSSTDSDIEFFNNWADIEKNSIGEISNCEIKHIINSFYHGSIKSVTKLKGRGNSRIYKLLDNKGNNIVLKDYPNLSVDPRSRMQTEVNALRLIQHLGKTPKVLAFDDSQNVALYEWIKGESIYNIENHHITQALNFIKNLQTFEVKYSFCEASEACLTAKELMKQIVLRFDRLLKIKNTDLNNFLVQTFKPLLKNVFVYSRTNWPSNNLEKKLPRTKQVYSPSDFGFHNAILKESGDLVFVDFEYFGRDDPVKLIADFIWHPGMKLSNLQKLDWIKGAFSIFQNDADLAARFKSAWPLYGLRWALIVLNEFLEDGWNKRIYANENLRDKNIKKLESQLIKAKNICEKIKLNNMKCPYVVNLDFKTS